MSYFLNAFAFLIGLAFDLVAVLMVLRVAAEAARADFHNPISQMIYRYTNPALGPVRRVLPNWRRINLAALLLAWAALAIKRWLLLVLGGIAPGVVGLLVLALADLLNFVLWFTIVLVFAWSLLSMVSTDRGQPLLRLLDALVAPLMRPLRGRLVVGAIDFAPMAILIGLFLAQMLVVAPLMDLGMQLAMR